MAPVIVLIRHAQAIHNLLQDPSLPDPDLSPTGREQCLRLRESLQTKLPADIIENTERIVVSPMRRTIETALRSLDWLLERGIQIQANAGWQENSDYPCDTGSPIPALKQEFPQIDYSVLDPVFPEKRSQAGARYQYRRQAILTRAHFCLDELYNMPGKYVIVVSHSGFLRLGITGCWFDNADYRIFNLQKAHGREGFSLKQWEFTKTGGLGLSWVEEVEVGEGLPEDEGGPKTF